MTELEDSNLLLKKIFGNSNSQTEEGNDDSFEEESITLESYVSNYLKITQLHHGLYENDSDDDSFDCISSVSSESLIRESLSDGDNDVDDGCINLNDIMESVLDIFHESFGIEFDDFKFDDENDQVLIQCDLEVSKKFVKFLVEKKLLDFMNSCSSFSFLKIPSSSWGMEEIRMNACTIRVNCEDLDSLLHKLEVTVRRYGY